MRRFFASWRKLKGLGVLGINRRNAEFILDHNPRSLYPLVDDKLRMRDLCQRIGVPTPQVFASISAHSMLRRLVEHVRNREDFVIKPNRGAAGRGVLVIVGRLGEKFIRHNGEPLSADHIRQHVSDILSGMYSLAGLPDQALVQKRVQLHPAFQPVAYQGIPDIRVVLYRHEPAMAMLRLPTKESNGRANLHQGGIGAGIDLASGFTHHAVQRNRFVLTHPDTSIPVIGMRVPHWNQVLDMSRRVSREVELGYIGVDIVVDAEEGPMLLEANARPGLAIQIANARGLLSRLAEIDAQLNCPTPKSAKVRTIATQAEPLRKSA